MATGVVVGSILLAADQELGVEELAVAAGADLVDGGGVQVNEDGPGNVFAAAGLREEGVEGAWVANVLDVGVGAAIRAEAVLQKVAGERHGSAASSKRRQMDGGGEPTAPRRCYQAGYQPGPGASEGPSEVLSTS